MMINADFSQDMQRCRDYIHALEEERRKIQVFQRELPLSLELVQQAIEAYKQQLSGTTVECNLTGQSECSEQTSSDAPVFEEFIPIKRASSQSDEHNSDKDEDDDDDDEDDGKTVYCNDKNSKKSDWLRSVQLWNQSPDPSPNEDSIQKTEMKRSVSGNNDGAFHPFKKDNSVEKSETPPSPPPQPPVETSGGGNKKDDKDGRQSNRKTRRCWSPELHRRFLKALEELGGSHVGTPKQIRELMKVDGLTNDEVKSHLQKYRLHTRRPTPTIQNSMAQPPQFVVVGGIWVPPEYATMAATTPTTANSAGIYAPVATLPPHLAKRKRPLESDDDGCRKSNSPASSSSTRITLSDH